MTSGRGAVQLHTGLVHEGPGVARRICVGLLERLDREGLRSIAELASIGG